MAADAMSGPTGLAAYLRSRLLGAPYNSASLPLDVGRARDIPDHIRRAVILRDKHCGWPSRRLRRGPRQAGASPRAALPRAARPGWRT